MKKIFTFWAFLMLVAIGSQAAFQLPRFAQQDLGPAPKREAVKVGQRIKVGAPDAMRAISDNLNDGDASVYAFQVYASSGTLHGWYNFQAQDPSNRELVADFGDQAGDYGIAAATYANGKTIAYIMQMYGSREAGWTEILMPVGLAELDELTGEWVLKFSTENFHVGQYNHLFNELTYDPTTNKIYAKELAFDASGNWLDGCVNIYEINPSTLEPTFVGRVDQLFLNMAAHDGFLYGIVQEGDADGRVTKTNLMKADMSATDGNFKATQVASVPEGAAFNYALSTMEFDHTTHKLWWLGYKDATPFMAELNIKSAQLSNMNFLTRQSQMLGLTIPYQTAAAEAPAQVTDLSVVSAENGVDNAIITWKNPSKNYNGDKLTDIQGVKIYRNDTLVATVETTSVGGSMTYTDSSIGYGLYIYKLVAYNAAGDGLYKEQEAYIGEDAPNYVVNLQAHPDGAEVTLTWVAPQSGLHQGWFDASAVVYDVYRGTYKAAEGISATTFSDKVNRYDNYIYRVVPRTSVGEGPGIEISVSFGPANELPYENDLSDEDSADELSAIDGNKDYNTWQYTSGYKGFEYITSLDYKANDYLVLPPVELAAGQKYELNFSYYTSNYIETYELLNVVVGREATVEALNTTIAEYNLPAGSKGAKWYNTKVQYVAEEDGVHYFAFHAISEPYMGFIIINNILLREMDATEVSALAITGPTEINFGETATINVKVRAEGLEDATDVTVSLVDENGKVYAETEVASIAAGETVDVPVEWTPTEQADLRLYGKASVAGDYFQDDDVTPEFLAVSVLSEGSDKWLTIGYDDTDFYDNRLMDLSRKCSRTQIIFYPDELETENNITLTGLRLHYGASMSANILTGIPVSIRLKNTDARGIIDTWYISSAANNKFADGDALVRDLGGCIFQSEGLTTVFEGTIDLTGEDPITNIVEIKFDTPFEYNKDLNLLVDIEKIHNKTYENVKWHMCYNENHLPEDTGYLDPDGDPITYGHMGYYNWSTPHDPTDKPGTQGDNWNTSTYVFPYIKFAYQGERVGVEAVTATEAFKIFSAEDALNFNSVCDFVEIYSFAGIKVAAAKNASSISTSELPAGIYVVRALVDGNVVAKKVMIK